MMAIEDQEAKDVKPRKSLRQMQIETGLNDGNDPWGCPSCGCRDLRVTNTWLHNGCRKRLRKCRNCGTPVTTLEKFEE